MEELLELIQRHRRAYAYPAFRIQICASQAELDFGGGVFGYFCENPRELTGADLDQYHHQLLTSDSKP